VALAGTPAAALAQSAGDEQYADPLAGQQQAKPDAPASSGDSGGNAGTGTPAATPQSTPAAARTAATPTTASTPSNQLPRTGLDVAPLVATGIPLLAAGLGLLWLLGPAQRRRRREPTVLFDGTLPPLR
jgi:hypothetical protein